MTSRKSSGSMRAESAVEPTRSENITVTWRRSALSVGALPCVRTASGAGAVALSSVRSAAIASSSLRPVPDDTDAQILQVLRRQVRQYRLIDLVFAESGLVPFKAKAPQPTVDVQVQSPGLLSAVDSEKG
jgi:hypothetical protein